MNGWPSNSTLGLGGVMASMGFSLVVRLEIVRELDLAPVAGPGAFETGRVVARLDGGVDADLAGNAPGKLPVERTRGGIVGRATRARHDDDVAPRIAARRDRVVDVARIVEIGVGAHRHHHL